MKQWAKQSGFTIVELLIVIVVIAILAAITIVAYTGIQERAQTASVQSASSQAGKKIEAFAVTNVDTYPDTLSEVDIIDSSDITYTYIVNNTTNPKNFCLSVADAQNPAISYSFTNSSGSTIEGECVRNLALDPDVTSTSSFQNIGNGSADFTASIDTTTYHDGVGSYRKLITSTGQSPGAIKPDNTITLNAGTPLSWSFWARPTRGGSIVTYTEGNRVSNSTYFGSGGSSTVSTPANQWTRVTGSIASLSESVRLSRIGGYNLQLQSGDRVWYDSYMVTATTYQLEYRDGGSPGWAWDGPANNSTSFGPSKRI